MSVTGEWRASRNRRVDLSADVVLVRQPDSLASSGVHIPNQEEYLKKVLRSPELQRERQEFNLLSLFKRR